MLPGKRVIESAHPTAKLIINVEPKQPFKARPVDLVRKPAQQNA